MIVCTGKISREGISLTIDPVWADKQARDRDDESPFCSDETPLCEMLDGGDEDAYFGE